MRTAGVRSIGPWAAQHGEEAQSAGSSHGEIADSPALEAVRAPLTPIEELRLLDAWKQGDDAALERLLRSYERRIYAICYRMTRSVHDARDAAQDVLVKLIENFEGYDRRAKLSTWIIRIAMNTCISHLRREKLRRHAPLTGQLSGDDAQGGGMGTGGIGGAGSAAGPLSAATGAGPGTFGRELSAGERVEQDERHAALRRALGALDPEARAVLILRDVQGLEYQQLAEVLETPLGTVKSRLFRARVALREALDIEERIGGSGQGSGSSSE